MFSIGSAPRSATEIVQQFGLAPFRSVLSSQEFQTVAEQTGCTPKRNRPLIPEVVAWLMMYVALYTESMTQGLLQAWGLVGQLRPDLQTHPVSEEAFCQARKDLNLAFWKTLWRRLRCRYEQCFDDQMRWRGFRILAADGTDANLPNVPALARFFGRPKGRHGQSRTPQARMVALCSVFTGFCIAFKFVSLRFTEHAALQHLIRWLKTDDLILLDRGFFSLPGYLADPTARCRVRHAPVKSSRWIRQTHPVPCSG
jgi:hypothetical protein